ncbi:MAG: hypothetical protein ACM32F_07300, partial [Betaproteobacteria bacterium]
ESAPGYDWRCAGGMAGMPIEATGIEIFIVVVNSHDAAPVACVLVTTCKEAPHRLRSVKILPVGPAGQSSVFADH